MDYDLLKLFLMLGFLAVVFIFVVAVIAIAIRWIKRPYKHIPFD